MDNEHIWSNMIVFWSEHMNNLRPVWFVLRFGHKLINNEWNVHSIGRFDPEISESDFYSEKKHEEDFAENSNSLQTMCKLDLLYETKQCTHKRSRLKLYLDDYFLFGLTADKQFSNVNWSLVLKSRGQQTITSQMQSKPFRVWMLFGVRAWSNFFEFIRKLLVHISMDWFCYFNCNSSEEMLIYWNVRKNLLFARITINACELFHWIRFPLTGTIICIVSITSFSMRIFDCDVNNTKIKSNLPISLQLKAQEYCAQSEISVLTCNIIACEIFPNIKSRLLHCNGFLIGSQCVWWRFQVNCAINSCNHLEIAGKSGFSA